MQTIKQQNDDMQATVQIKDTEELRMTLDQQMQQDLAWLKENHAFENDSAVIRAALSVLRENFSRELEDQLTREELARQTRMSRDDFG